MIVKAFEILDRHTFIPALGVLMVPGGILTKDLFGSSYDAEIYLLRRAGYNFDHPCILLCRMEASGTDRNATYDPFSWGDRTMTVAHQHIEKNWESLYSGDVVDVEFVLGEVKEPKTSERIV